MMFSRKIMGTNSKKVQLSWGEYIFTHMIPTWFQSFSDNYRMWADLVLFSNYENYALLKDDDPFEECRDWFWSSINTDDVLPKFFIEELMQMADDLDKGKVNLIPWVQEEFEDILKE